MYLTSICYLFYFIASVYGFCIYNKTPDFDLFIHQEPLHAGGNYLSRFKRDKLKPNEQACCPYTDYDCNSNGSKDAILLMTFKTTFLGVDRKMFTLKLPAGGWVEFLPNGANDPIIQVFEADGTSFNFDYQTDVNEMLLY